jgi:hypothetical protein
MVYKKSIGNIIVLIELTARMMLKYNIQDMLEVKMSRNEHSIWEMISKEYFKNFSYKNVLSLKQWWSRNRQDYATRTKDLLRILKTNLNDNSLQSYDDGKTKKSITLQTIEIVFHSNEYDQIIKCISNNKRKKFNSEFINLLSNKWQEAGQFCWFKYVYNWFKSDSNTKKTTPFWRAKLRCIDLNCKGTFNAIIEAEIIKNHSVNVQICFNKSMVKHKEKIKRDNRCSKERRIAVASNIYLKGLTNVHSENIIYNNQENNFLKRNLTIIIFFTF